MSSTRQDMRPARAAYWSGLREQALAEDPALIGYPAALEARAEELDRAVRGRGGRRSAASRAAERRRFDVIVEHYELLCEIARADPFTKCLHDWPGDLVEDPFCQRCGLPYAEAAA